MYRPLHDVEDSLSSYEANKQRHTTKDLEENIILHAAVHVKQARSQQILANFKINEEKISADEVNKVDHDNKIQTIIMDYCQNLNLPHLGKDQLGDTYYILQYLSIALVSAMM